MTVTAGLPDDILFTPHQLSSLSPRGRHGHDGARDTHTLHITPLTPRLSTDLHCQIFVTSQVGQQRSPDKEQLWPVCCSHNVHCVLSILDWPDLNVYSFPGRAEYGGQGVAGRVESPGLAGVCLLSGVPATGLQAHGVGLIKC